MHAKALTVHWHLDNQPIYSGHFQPGQQHSITRLATAGGDNNIRIWRLNYSKGSSETSSNEVSGVTYLATLSRHTQAVNVVRFDPKGQVLASAGDDGTILLWTLSDTITREFGSDDSELDKETWKLRHACRVSSSEVYDLAWSPDSQYIIAGSMDNVARIYNASNGQCIRQLAEHQHYVQGVSWDPLNEYIATQSSDRSVHIYTLKTKNGQFSLSNPHKISKADLTTVTPRASRRDSDVSASGSVGASNSAPGTPRSMNPPPNKTHSRKSSFSNNKSDSPSSIPLPAVRSIGSPSMSPALLSQPAPPAGMQQTATPSNLSHSSGTVLYHNETFTSFFRRLCFTPDGSLLLTPSGIFKYTGSESEEFTNTVYIYTRAGLNRSPVAYLPGLKKPSLAVKCSPVLYKLKEEEEFADGNPTTKKFDLNKSTVTPVTSADPTQSSTSTLDEGRAEPSSPVFKLDYRVVYAVATQDSVIVYDTQHKAPLCIASNLHYATFTDLTWSPDGNTLLMTSTDGFCSVITFDEGELGVRYTGPLPTKSASNTPTLSNASLAGLSALSPSTHAASFPSNGAASPSSVLFAAPSPLPMPMHASPSGSHAELWSSPISTPASTSFSDTTGPPLVPIVSSVPPVASHGIGVSPPATPLSQSSPPKRQEDQPSGHEKKKRRVAPTLVKSEKN